MTTTAQQNHLVALFKAATVIPVLTIERIQDAVPLARALGAGGVRTLEVTLRTPVAIEAARAMMAEVPEAIVGIGTILNPADFTRVEKLGVAFGISPGLTPDLLKAATDSSLPFAPGIATASELMMALSYGFDVAKFFPGRAGRRHQGPARSRRAVPERAVLPHRWRRRGQCGELAGGAQRGCGRRLLAVPDGGDPGWELGGHNCHLPAHRPGPESRVKSCHLWAKI
ncbi:2-keto-3-deoxy-6-phosphogluconate aldolase [Bradyrhizobium sp. USDA 329]